ncbi:hypothetical protein BaRGS_00018030 [Batillaria attramentaria]|uniref:PDZ domain-containing protein n=1 Tax=Batillaria attramentaria TaxID=370345 RepID=A0ABD0KUM9_9CAEN
MAGSIVQLHRSPGQSWGFRLGGGLDFGQQLTVKKDQPDGRQIKNNLLCMPRADSSACRLLLIRTESTGVSGYLLRLKLRSCGPTVIALLAVPLWESHPELRPDCVVSRTKFHVEPGTPSAGALAPGDKILGIGNTNARQLTHMQAHQLIKSAGNSLQLTLIRGPSTDFSAIKPKGPVKFSPWKHN